MQYIHKKEPGNGGPTYAICFLGILIAIILFLYLTFCADLFLIKDTLKMGIHFAESKALTQNSHYEDEDSRIHIIPNHNPGDILVKSDGKMYLQDGTLIDNIVITSDMSIEEETEVKNAANAFLNSLIEQYCLKDRLYPQAGVLANRCGKDSRVEVTKLVIYEPIYGLNVTSNKINEGDSDTEDDDPDFSFVKEDYEFILSYDILKWIKYEIPCVNNEINGTILKTECVGHPYLYNGEMAAGATIETTVSVRINGIKQFFAPMDSNKLFADNPEQKNYHVSITQAYDITLIDLDNRNINCSPICRCCNEPIK